MLGLTSNPTVFLLLVFAAVDGPRHGARRDRRAHADGADPPADRAAYDVDPIALGVLMILSQMIGLLTPPVGTVIFVLQAITKARMAEVFWGSLPFMVPLLAALPGDHLLAGRDPLPAREAGAVSARDATRRESVLVGTDRPGGRSVPDPGDARARGRPPRAALRLQGRRPATTAAVGRRPPGAPARRGGRARLRRSQRHPSGQAGDGAAGRRARTRGRARSARSTRC